MATLLEHAGGWHAGERAVHELLHVPLRGQNPTAYGLPGPYAYRVMASPLVALGTLDAAGRPWTTVWGGEAQFARPIAQSVLGLQSLVDAVHDPVVAALYGHGAPAGELVRPDGGAKPISGLSIDLETRDRVKLAGTMVAGALGPRPTDGPGDEAGDEIKGVSSVAEAQLAFHVQESLGNCPKYLNKKHITPHVPTPELVSDSLPLPPEAVALLAKADLFFLSSADGAGRTMDTNHRGGPPGLVRVARNNATTATAADDDDNDDEDGGTVLVYPEFSGNRLYQTLGNLQANPRLGIAVPDFDTGDVLYATGTTRLLVGAAAAALMPHTNLAVRLRLTAARFVRRGLPFRGAAIDLSPYNPPVRRLASEGGGQAGADPTAGPPGGVATARLVRREALAPGLARFTFRLGGVRAGTRAWRAGQSATMDFSAELDHGWSHMRDDDPTSLNDDYVRTFTVSGPAPPAATGGDNDEDEGGGELREGTEMQLTLRRVGAATGLLFAAPVRAGLEVPVVGFAGEEGFRLLTTDAAGGGREAVFVAGGVGITPLLAQAGAVLAGEDGGVGRLRVVWSLRGTELGLAADAFARAAGLAARTGLFVTGGAGAVDGEALERVKGAGAAVTMGRVRREDVLGGGEGPRKFYVCAGEGMAKVVAGWLEGEEVVSESFGY